MYEFRRAGTDDPELFYYDSHSTAPDKKIPLLFDPNIIGLKKDVTSHTLGVRRANALCLNERHLTGMIHATSLEALLSDEIVKLDAVGAILPTRPISTGSEIFMPEVAVWYEGKTPLKTALDRLKLPFAFTIERDPPSTPIYCLDVTSGQWREALKLMQMIWEAHVPRLSMSQPNFACNIHMVAC